MLENDNKIKELIKKIAIKKNELGQRPKIAYKTNCKIKEKNIQAINTLRELIEEFTPIQLEFNFFNNSAKELEIDCQNPDIQGYSFLDWKEDFISRKKVILWEKENKDLKSMESKLKDLMSLEGKTQIAIEEIEKSL